MPRLPAWPRPKMLPPISESRSMLTGTPSMMNSGWPEPVNVDCPRIWMLDEAPGPAARLNDLNARGLGLQCLHQVDFGSPLQDLGAHRLDRVRQGPFFPFDAERGDHDPLDLDRLLHELKVRHNRGARGDRDRLLACGIPDGLDPHRVGARRDIQDDETPVRVAQVPAVRSVNAYLRAGDRCRVHAIPDRPRHRAGLLGGKARSDNQREEPQTESSNHGFRHCSPPPG